MAVVAAPSRSQHVEMKNFAVELPTGKLMRQALQDANQIARLSAAAGNALTTVLAGFALTTTSWPDIIFFPAFVAGFRLVLILARPGMVNTPDFLTSVAPTSANLPKSFETTAFFKSELVASESARAPLLMAFGAAFIAAFILFGALRREKLMQEASNCKPQQ